MKSPRGQILSLLAALILLPLLAVGGAYGQGTPAGSKSTAALNADLPLIGSYDNLLKLLEKSSGQIQMFDRAQISGSASKAFDQAVSTLPAATAVPEYSNTNVQVEGVDEADLVKTDGTYIYHVNKERVLIIKAQPAEPMQVVSTLQFESSGFKPLDLYLDDQNLIVIGSYYRENTIEPEDQLKVHIYPPLRAFQTTSAIVYDIQDPLQPQKVRELELEGNYLTSRKVDSSFYLLTNKYLDYYRVQNHEEITPQWRDSIQGDSFFAQELKEIRYFPDCISPNYLMVAAVDLNTSAKADIHSYLGSGEEVYASQQNLYVAVQQINYASNGTLRKGTEYQPPENNTKLYKFALQPGRVQYVSNGTVPGTILNQFSMDENGGYLRIATTSGEVWRNDQYTSQNNVFILDADLQIRGKLENIAPGEKIYSTRFMGDRAYMVTFKQVDPFFVLDLKDPLQPRILGKLKIPGYSDYLQPYDENHIIGFGKDTVEIKGWNDQPQAFYLGMKAAIFDVTDVNKPVEMSRATIGDRGTDSEVLHNHKALLFSAEKNLLAFPVTVMEVEDKNTNKQSDVQIPAYGSFAFQGLYVYQIDLNDGLQFRGRISHLSSEDTLKAGDAWYDSDRNVERALYIDDTIYTLSPGFIKAHNLSDLQEIACLSLL